jgi:hypothetical protein
LTYLREGRSREFFSSIVVICAKYGEGRFFGSFDRHCFR